MSSLKTSMQSHVMQYLFTEISLDDFTDWLVSATWNIDAEQDVEASDLAFSIELALAEAASGLLTPSELQTALREMVNPSQRASHASLQPLADLGGSRRESLEPPKRKMG